MKAWMSGCGLLLALAAGCGVFGGQGRVIRGSGNLATETRPVSGLSGVALLGQGEVVVTQGATEGLTIEAEDNLLPLLTSEVRSGTLTLSVDPAISPNTIDPTRPIRYLVTVTDLSALDLTGSGSLTAQSLVVDDLTLTLNGAGAINIDHLEAETLRVDLNGTGEVTLAGLATEQTIALNGTGTYLAGELESQLADVRLGGVGEVTLWVRQNLDITISGSGNVNFFGTPSITRRDITGTGDINPMGDK